MAPSAKPTYPYEPDYAVPPGATLQETIDSLGMTQRELAVRTGLTAALQALAAAPATALLSC